MQYFSLLECEKDIAFQPWEQVVRQGLKIRHYKRFAPDDRKGERFIEEMMPDRERSLRYHIEQWVRENRRALRRGNQRRMGPCVCADCVVAFQPN
jgi:hypothetical protein